MRARPTEAGSLMLFVAVVVVGLFFAFGLVLDGGYLLAARRATLNEADGAARAGAQQVTADSIAAGRVVLDPDGVTAAVRDFLSATGHESSVVVDQDTVTVTVRSSYRPKVLPIGTRRVTGVGTAHAQRGI